jgi:catechol 2,3-dioxygenase-like lactoylglutathione lyase family enzyme
VPPFLVDFLGVRLQTSSAAAPELADFYGLRLGLEPLGETRFRIGATELEFVAAGADPFYHFALLVPGNRFDAALDWAGERVELLPDPESREPVFDFSFWSALACYFHDPAGNIVELIVHRGIGESSAAGAFSGQELLGFSELGLVGNVKGMARELEPLGLRVWSGTVDEPGRLAFVGEQARTLILCPRGRGWLPTGRPAEPHPVDAALSGQPEREVTVGGHRIRRAG